MRTSLVQFELVGGGLYLLHQCYSEGRIGCSHPPKELSCSCKCHKGRVR